MSLGRIVTCIVFLKGSDVWCAVFGFHGLAAISAVPLLVHHFWLWIWHEGISIVLCGRPAVMAL